MIPAPGDPKRSALLIFGSDVRGTIYGVTDLSREMGVSPWEWWADVTIRKVPKIAVDGATRFSHEPSVHYRAIFLNDEDFGLKPWSAKTYEPEVGSIGPKTYARIFELMWRLKANTIWPAMHKGTIAFDDVPGNAEMSGRLRNHSARRRTPNRDAAQQRPRMGSGQARGVQLADQPQGADRLLGRGAVAGHAQFENIYTRRPAGASAIIRCWAPTGRPRCATSCRT